MDRRSATANQTARQQAAGESRPMADTDIQSRFYAGALANRQWQILRGSVIMALPQLGWHAVAVEGLGGIFKAQTVGQADAWGTQTVRTLQNHTDVLLAVQPKTHACAIVGQLPRELSEPGDEFSQQTFVGSWSGLARDPGAFEYSNIGKESGRLNGFDINAFWDQHAGDWGCRTNTGVLVLVDPLSIRLATDDVTEIYLDYLSQSVEVSGRRGSWRTDGVLIADRDGGNYASLMLGQSGWLSNVSPELIDKRETVDKTNAYRNTLAGWMVDWVGDGATLLDPTGAVAVQSYAFGMHCFSLGTGFLSEHFGGNSRQQHATGSHVVSGRFTSMCSDVVGWHESCETGVVSAQYAASAFSKISPLLFTNGEYGGLFDTGSIAGSFVSLFYPMHAAGEHGLSKELSEVTGETVTVRTAILRDNPDLFAASEKSAADVDKEFDTEFRSVESVIQVFAAKSVADGGPEFYSPDASLVRGDGKLLSASTVDRLTSDMSWINEHGAGIRIVGSTVYIEGAQIRLSAVKDVVVLGRDLQLHSNRNVTISSGKHTRLYSQKNVAILSGISGRGGTLLENRSTGPSQLLPDDAEKAEYSGIIIKAVPSQIALLGGGLLLKAGDSRRGIGGNVSIRSEGGDMLLSSQGKFVCHSTGGRIDTFGRDNRDPDASNYYGPFVNLFSGQVSADSIWSQGSIVARSHIQSVTGQLADSVGRGVGRVIQKEALLKSLDSLSKSREVQRRSAVDLVENFNTRYGSKGHILHSDTFAEVSTAFAKDSSAKSYGTVKIATTLQHSYRSSYRNVALEDFHFAKVVYKPDVPGKRSVTVSWPGDSSVVRSARSRGDLRVSNFLRQAASAVGSGSGTVAQIEALYPLEAPAAATPAEIFATLRDEAEQVSGDEPSPGDQ